MNIVTIERGEITDKPVSVREFCEANLRGDVWGPCGVTEEAARRAGNNSAAIGRLMEALAVKGVLTAKDVATIVGAYCDDAEFED